MLSTGPMNAKSVMCDSPQDVSTIKQSLQSALSLAYEIGGRCQSIGEVTGCLKPEPSNGLCEAQTPTIESLTQSLQVALEQCQRRLDTIQTRLG